MAKKVVKVKAGKRKGKIVKPHTRKIDAAKGMKKSPLSGKEFATMGEKMEYIRSLRKTKKPGTKKTAAPAKQSSDGGAGVTKKTV